MDHATQWCRLGFPSTDVAKVLDSFEGSPQGLFDVIVFLRLLRKVERAAGNGGKSTDMIEVRPATAAPVASGPTAATYPPEIISGAGSVKVFEWPISEMAEFEFGRAADTEEDEIDFDSLVVITGFPCVKAEYQEHVKTAMRELLRHVSGPKAAPRSGGASVSGLRSLHVPMDESTIRGVIFAEFSSPAEATLASKVISGFSCFTPPVSRAANVTDSAGECVEATEVPSLLQARRWSNNVFGEGGGGNGSKDDEKSACEPEPGSTYLYRDGNTDHSSPLVYESDKNGSGKGMNGDKDTLGNERNDGEVVLSDDEQERDLQNGSAEGGRSDFNTYCDSRVVPPSMYSLLEAEDTKDQDSVDGRCSNASERIVKGGEDDEYIRDTQPGELSEGGHRLEKLQRLSLQWRRDLALSERRRRAAERQAGDLAAAADVAGDERDRAMAQCRHQEHLLLELRALGERHKRSARHATEAMRQMRARLHAAEANAAEAEARARVLGEEVVALSARLVARATPSMDEGDGSDGRSRPGRDDEEEEDEEEDSEVLVARESIMNVGTSLGREERMQLSRSRRRRQMREGRGRIERRERMRVHGIESDHQRHSRSRHDRHRRRDRRCRQNDFRSTEDVDAGEECVGGLGRDMASEYSSSDDSDSRREFRGQRRLRRKSAHFGRTEEKNGDDGEGCEATVLPTLRLEMFLPSLSSRKMRDFSSWESAFLQALEAAPQATSFRAKTGAKSMAAAAAATGGSLGEKDGKTLFRGTSSELSCVISCLERLTRRVTAMKEAREEAEKREMQRMLSEESERRICSICMDKPRDVLILPCRHLCCCQDCAPKLDRCPMCRAEIEGRMAIFA